MSGRENFAKHKKIIYLFVKIHSMLPNRLKKRLINSYRNISGTKGLVLRYALYKTICKKCGECISIFPNVYLLNAMNLSMGDNISIHPMSYIEAWGGVKIGSEVSIAHGVTILSVSHNFNDIDIPIRRQNLISKPVEIADDVWIGAKATILGGITVEKGSIIGANAIVTNNVPLYAVVAGNPARILNIRKKMINSEKNT